jgi:carboxylesterase type B
MSATEIFLGLFLLLVSSTNCTENLFQGHLNHCSSRSGSHVNRSGTGFRSGNNNPNYGVVKTQSGFISGEETEEGFSFRGVPYAEPPVGKLRFAPPQYFKRKWPVIREFTKFGAKCAQFNHFGYKFDGDEDCLTLNIFVPYKIMKSHTINPVIVFIHGGAFMFGGSQYYGPENFYDDKRMVVVTINYRLGILGFLSTEDDVIPGNFGMKDQVEALKWIQRNIEGFKGDPKRVTIVGFSAGGASVHLHYMSDLTKGLFASGISHSGNALDPWVIQEKAKEKALEIGVRFGCRKTEKKDWLLSCLRLVDLEALVMYASHFQGFMYNPFSPFGVVIEKPLPGAYLYNNPREIVKRQKPIYYQVPWILSQTEVEGLYPAAEFIDRNIMATVDRKWTSIAPYLLDFAREVDDPEKQASLTMDIRTNYFQNNPIDMRRMPNFIQVIHIDN